MAFTPNDTLQKQIQRGEVWTGSHAVELESQEDIYYGIEVGARNTEFVFEVYIPAEVTVRIVEAPTLSGGTPFPEINMERSGSYSTDVTASIDSTSSGGSFILSNQVPELHGANVLFSGKAGFILKANTDYSYYVKNNSAQKVLHAVQWFYREIG